MKNEKFNFISFPRSGSHFFNNVIRFYLGGQEQYQKYIRHDHDEFLKESIEGALYLYRDIKDTVFSYLVASYSIQDVEIKNYEIYKDWILSCNERIKDHHKFYLDRSLLIIKFEDLIKSDLNQYWPLIFDFFKIPYNEEGVRLSISENTKQKLAVNINSDYMNKRMLLPVYSENRNRFKAFYNKSIS